MIIDKSKNFAPEIAQENAKKFKTAKKSNLNSFASLCGVDLDDSGKNLVLMIFPRGDKSKQLNFIK